MNKRRMTPEFLEYLKDKKSRKEDDSKDSFEDSGSKDTEEKDDSSRFLGYLKKKDAKREDGSEMDDKEKRKAALNKARKYQESKRKKEED